MNTPTPRTDYLLSDYVTVDQLIDHAREIETELNAITEQRDKLAEDLNKMISICFTRTSQRTHRRSECAAPKTLKINNMKKNDVNNAAPSVDVPRLVRPSVFDEPPLHMDTLSRNERLYKTLLGMGLYVEPIKGSEGGISKFIVSCGLTS